MRLFIAIPLPDEVRCALGAVRKAEVLRGSGVRWVRSELVHLTLRFLGEVAQERLSSVTEVVQETSLKHPTFMMEVAGLGAFPSWKRPRVFWAGVRPCPELEGVQEALERGVAAAGFAPDREAFHAHVTLARIQSAEFRIKPELLERFESFGRIRVEEIVVVESVLSPSGPSYHSRACAKLGASGPAKAGGLF